MFKKRDLSKTEQGRKEGGGGGGGCWRQKKKKRRYTTSLDSGCHYSDLVQQECVCCHFPSRWWQLVSLGCCWLKHRDTCFTYQNCRAFHLKRRHLQWQHFYWQVKPPQIRRAGLISLHRRIYAFWKPLKEPRSTHLEPVVEEYSAATPQHQNYEIITHMNYI